MLNGVNKANALILARRILSGVNSYRFGTKRHRVKMKLSLAVAAHPEDTIHQAMDLVLLADQALNKAKENGGNQICSATDVRKGSYEHIDLNPDIHSLGEKLKKLTKRSNQSLAEATFAFAKTIELKDHYSGEHVERTVHYAADIAQALGLPADRVEIIKQAAMLHDLGKIGIRKEILHKNSELNPKEMAEIKRHPQIGVDIIRPIHFFQPVIPLILYHHERWDGKGYPYGLKKEEIPLGCVDCRPCGCVSSADLRPAIS
ncbi:MAG: hypothetical protein A3G33_04875 [Omnitrophica bacterium RIFCSPLOWO2_12_FULL_44_17]|uniref:HD-GYP domain-containing protein n=1 Tax=Candidatus Danuiimicrobium aquiferis TaxID=1801832 RepID=A0A1G1KQR6_9BACT|nr:MAG: hypothetical protein A3B72_11090 [Omnitrophica bacterium RIFCSPHIGHO2_02_FULL_45_28]OGW88612.1 MAG: hypothetical protein A3E74_06485 [Omnitrophica bacterium RIFCSPHIGHO2_12_FULL_44_12]OGW95263.1 MAG: hypothetical protein A3G33_04875 [Omnitrophica bacterium RIFCSPLOWO2_12_FULL_44_17]OGX02358.1 MAG: hypothetical protein A3J12_10210 [Omnitrophica bacterium RIFCSPLOWO2_02_FULL_44_11]